LLAGFVNTALAFGASVQQSITAIPGEPELPHNKGTRTIAIVRGKNLAQTGLAHHYLYYVWQYFEGHFVKVTPEAR
jgi:hypothetical protein